MWFLRFLCCMNAHFPQPPESFGVASAQHANIWIHMREDQSIMDEMLFASTERVYRAFHFGIS